MKISDSTVSLMADAIMDHPSNCPCWPDGEIEEGPAGATYSMPCSHRGLRQAAERRARRALTDDRVLEALAGDLGISWEYE